MKTRKFSNLTLILKAKNPKELVDLNEACGELIKNFYFFGEAKAEITKWKGQYHINPLKENYIGGVGIRFESYGRINVATDSSFDIQTPQKLYFFQKKHNPIYAPFNLEEK